MNPAPLRLTRAFLPVVLCALCVLPELTVAKPAKVKMRNGDADGTADVAEAKPRKREEKASTKTDENAAGDNDSRQLARLRERLGVDDDAEWAIIAERITKVEELRRTLATGSGPRALAVPTDRAKRSPRGGSAGGAEIEALRSAVADEYPDAEIKARLARAHEAHQQRESQLLRAQADLRAVLTVRQEAMLVMAGLLPP